MKRRIFAAATATVCLWLVLTLACSDPAAPPPPKAASETTTPTQATIVVMGDSLTEGLGVAEAEAFPALLENKLHEAGFSWRVINAGVSGETSSGALSRLEWVMRLEPDIVMIETGANDGLRGIDPQLVKRNLTAIVRFFKSREVTVVIAGMQMVRNLGEDYTQRFAAVYPEVARGEAVLLIPFLLQGVAARPELNQSDGIHPNAAGHRVIAETVFPYVVQAIEARAADRKAASTPDLAPTHRDSDRKQGAGESG